MGTTTAIHGIRIPVSTDLPDGPNQITAAADDIDVLLPIVDTTAPTAPGNGTIWRNSTTGELLIYNGTAWVTLLGDTGWLALVLAAGVITFPGGATPQCRTLNGVTHFRGQAAPLAGGNWPINDTISICDAGGIPVGSRIGLTRNVPVQSITAAEMVRGVVSGGVGGTSDGSLAIITFGSTGLYVDMSAFGPYIAEA